jgi:catechol 2,3-dioxygenase-like lactoylglutathione lyase family enzyme
VTPGVRICGAELAVGAGDLAALESFYVNRLGLTQTPGENDRLQLAVGSATLTFASRPDSTRPFYHFALLIPGNRFDAARAWLSVTAPLLSRPGEDATSFDFDAWDARACYAHDPAGNIVELIAHGGVEESDQTGPFDAREIRTLSEIGLVGAHLSEFVHALGPAGLELWSGAVNDGGSSLGFVGRQAHTLILCSAGRPWLPTGRPAESHPAEVRMTSQSGATVRLGVRDGSPVLRG